MKKLYALPVVAILAAAACTDTTAPNSSASLTPSYSKPTTTPTADSTFSTVNTRDFFNFSANQVTATGGAFFSTESTSGVGISSSPATTTSPSGEEFLGRFENTAVQAVLNVPNAGANYYLNFDLYAIGSLDGKGKQAQNGTFIANFYQVTLVCQSTGTSSLLFKSDFSNQLTVQQDYPANLAIGQTGGNKAGTGSYAQDLLNYKSAPTISNTPLFRSYGDTEYNIVLGGVNPCPAGTTIQFVFTSDLRQSNYDESFGIDNVLIKTGS
jgi:hypothetical protein